MAEPHYVYDPDAWEATYIWADRNVMLEHCDLDTHRRAGDVMRFGTLNKGPDKWAANVVLSYDEDGCPDETEIRWFDSEEAARAAVAKARKR